MLRLDCPASISFTSPMPAAHPSDDGPVLDAHVRCARCRYDLAGCRVLGACPECGLEVVASVAASSDPGVSGLAAPQQPYAASTAIVAATAAPLVALLVQGSGPAMRAVDALAGRGSSFPSQVERPSWLVSGAALAVAGVLVARGLGEARNPSLRAGLGAGRVRRLSGSLVAWAAVLLGGFVASLTPVGGYASLRIAVIAAQLLPAVWMLWALGPVLGRAGALSRAYREGAITAQVGTVAAQGYGEDIATLVWGLGSALSVLAAIGLAYLLANGWVIATALRSPVIDPRRFR
jgi:hypothetical protein